MTAASALTTSRFDPKSLAIAVACGAASALGFAPVGWWWLPPLALAVLFWQWAHAPRNRHGALTAAASGFAFGMGFFLTGVSWVYVSLHVFGQMPMLLAALATFLFCAYLALFPALAGWLVARNANEPVFRMVVLCPALFVLQEWVRGWMFTGFPWLGIGYTQAPAGALAGYAPLLGVYGIAWLVGLSAALLDMIWALRRDAERAIKAISAAVLVAIWGGGYLLNVLEWSRPSGPPVKVALLQGNVPQDRKWRPESRAATLDQYLKMATASDAQLVVFPETALPLFHDQLPPAYVQILAEHARRSGGDVLLGIVERTSVDNAFDYTNSVVSFGASGAQAYRKSHLVPFGEFIPTGFHWILAVLKIPMTDFVSGAADQRPLAVAGQRVAANICYEDAFGVEIIRQLPAATLLVNVSNMAWFGRSWAADQHFQMAQMRALETSRWMLRATNTGVTGAIDEKGRAFAVLPQFTTGTLTVMAQGRLGTTPYVVTGNWPILALLFAAVLLAWRPVNIRRTPRLPSENQ